MGGESKKTHGKENFSSNQKKRGGCSLLHVEAESAEGRRRGGFCSQDRGKGKRSSGERGGTARQRTAKVAMIKSGRASQSTWQSGIASLGVQELSKPE